MNLKTVSTTYILYGLINIVISAVSNNVLIHMIVLSGICFIAGLGLWMKRDWSMYPIIFFGLFTLIVGTSTLYASLRFVGLNPTLQILVFHLSLIGYILGALYVSIYTIVNISNMLGLDKRQIDAIDQVS